MDKQKFREIELLVRERLEYENTYKNFERIKQCLDADTSRADVSIIIKGIEMPINYWELSKLLSCAIHWYTDCVISVNKQIEEL